MKIIIKEDKLQKLVWKYMDEIYSDLEESQFMTTILGGKEVFDRYWGYKVGNLAFKETYSNDNQPYFGISNTEILRMRDLFGLTKDQLRGYFLTWAQNNLNVTAKYSYIVI